MRYFKAVNAMAHAWLWKGCVSAGMSPVLGSTPIVSPVNNGITHTIKVISKIAYVQKYMQICAHSGGLPLFFVSWFTRILKARNKIASMGAKSKGISCHANERKCCVYKHELNGEADHALHSSGH